MSLNARRALEMLKQSKAECVTAFASALRSHSLPRLSYQHVAIK